MEEISVQTCINCALIFYTLWWAVTVPCLRGQSIPAELEGTVNDVSGVIVPNAKPSVKNVVTGAIRTAVSNSSASFPGFTGRRLTGITPAPLQNHGGLKESV
jgi:hypothetical protein